VLACSPDLRAQAFAQGNVLNFVPPRKVVARRGAMVDSALPLELRAGYHVNSNTPSDEYLIPLRLTWNPGPLEASGFVFPKPRMEKYSFSEKPLSVFTGDFQILTHFKVSGTAASGPATLAGKLRYQACTNSMCLPPKTLDVSLQVEVVK
jgi:DsbC/DsbD-like thiol-disulfide interchange protein